MRLEQERKDRKKQKEKEKKERLKAEGKFLTPKQRADRQRAQGMLDALRAQGVEVPEVGGEKKTRLGTRIRKKNQLQTQQSTDDETKTNDESGPEATATESAESKQIIKEDAVAERIKDAWDEDSGDEEESKDTGSSNEASAEDALGSGEKKDKKSLAHNKHAKNGTAEDSVSDDEENSEDDSGGSSEDSDSDVENEHKTDAERKRDKAYARIHVSHLEELIKYYSSFFSKLIVLA